MKQGIAKFLGVYVPKININNAKITFLNEGEIGEKIWETPPQLYIKRVVIVEPREGAIIALGTVIVTESMCNGHFPFFKMLPLAILAQAVGQVGELLILSMNGNNGSHNNDKVPIVIKASEVRSMSNKGGTKQRRFVIPGDHLLVFMTHIGGRFGMHEVKADIYVEDGIMASIGGLTYYNVELKNFWEVRDGESMVKQDSGFRLPVSEGSQTIQRVA
ncbi:MAG: hypothetical protein UW11_C0019G0024 [Parcubacteria group bacterium GW2011_GWA2_43_9b]|nr:MAG: hypothetical protein UW11_C0019G0024 [Parcubacteria group bacterium GW2011_GWA2_43_9b]